MPDAPRTFRNFLTKESMNTLGEGFRARPNCKTGQYRELKHEAVHEVRKTKRRKSEDTVR